MQRLAVILTKYIFKKGIISEKYYDVYLYGFQSFLEILLNVICSIFIALFLHMEIECILFFLFFIPLRSYNGGFHLENYYACLFFSCLTLVCILLIVKYYYFGTTASFILFFISMVLTKLLGAVNHPNRPVDKEENTYFSKKANITFIISIFTAIIFVLFKQNSYLLLESLVYLLVFFTLLIGKIKYS